MNITGRKEISPMNRIITYILLAVILLSSFSAIVLSYNSYIGTNEVQQIPAENGNRFWSLVHRYFQTFMQKLKVIKTPVPAIAAVSAENSKTVFAPIITPVAEPDTSIIPEVTVNCIDYANEVVALVNAERTTQGYQALIIDSNLTEAAQIRAKELPVSFSHTRPDGSGFFTVFAEADILFKNAGENLAQGYENPKEVMQAWMNSKSHQANIMNADYAKIGVYCYYYNGRLYWAQEFTN